MSAKILYIEDNEQNLYLVTYILQKSGYRVVAARDGQEGIAAASREMPALILLDIHLPGMDGYTVAKKIRESSELAGVPIVAVTSYAMVGDRERALDAGCTGYIEKPIDPETFLSQIERHLSGKAFP
ncbi:MAG: response regulator [Nitrospirota bacterium]